VSKKLESKIVCLDTTLKQIEGIISYFQKYREEGFDASIKTAKCIASSMDVELKFPTNHQGKRKKHFDELNDETKELQLSTIQEFKVSYFLVIVDAAIASLTSRFKRLQKFEKNIWFFIQLGKSKVIG